MRQTRVSLVNALSLDRRCPLVVSLYVANAQSSSQSVRLKIGQVSATHSTQYTVWALKT